MNKNKIIYISGSWEKKQKRTEKAPTNRIGEIDFVTINLCQKTGFCGFNIQKLWTVYKQIPKKPCIILRQKMRTS